MTNDRFAAQLRRHLLETADERPADGHLASIADRVAVTAQRQTLVALLWPFGRVGPFPWAAVRLGLIAVLLLLLTLALVIVGGGAARSRPADDVLNSFLGARIAGAGAQQYLAVPEEDIPLLYSTSSGAPYERAEFEPVRGIDWPYGWTAFRVRMFAGDTVVEQLVFWNADRPLELEYNDDGFATDIAPTTEQGRPVAAAYTYFDGSVTVRPAHPWVWSSRTAFGRLIPEGPGVPPTTDGGQRNDWDHVALMPAPAWVGSDCRKGPDAADAAALAESIRSDPGLEVTAPVAVRVAETEALVLDVKIPAGAPLCVPATWGGDPLYDVGLLYNVFDQDALVVANHDDAMPEWERLAKGVATGQWMRLYLIDVPDGLSMRILVIAIVAQGSSFERAVGAAAPVVDSIEFRTP